MDKVLYAFRDDADFMIKFMGVVPPDYGVDMFVSELDDQGKWPENHYALYIDLYSLEVFLLDEGFEGETIGNNALLCSLPETLENALKEYFS